MRLACATLKAAMASEATVSSPRIIRIERSHGSGHFSSGASAPIASEMLALTAHGGTRRESCAQMRMRTFCESGLKRPRASRREPSPVDGSAPSPSASPGSSSSAACSSESCSSLSCASADWARRSRFAECFAAASVARARARARAT
eukprot:6004128-Prymnesium_polylepis.2